MPSFCLPVGDSAMAHCCMPYALSFSLSFSCTGQNLKPRKWRSEENLRCGWVVANKIVCTVRTWIMSEGMAERRIVWKPTRPVAFFPLLWSIFVCRTFGRLTKQLDDWRCVFFMWEPASVIHRENAIFYPQLLFMGSKCQKLLQSPKPNW